MSQHCKSARSLSFPVFLSSWQFIAAMFMTDAFLSSDASSSLSLLASLSLYLKAVVDAERRNLGSLSTASLELSHDALRRYLSVSVSVFRGSAVFVPPPPTLQPSTVVVVVQFPQIRVRIELASQVRIRDTIFLA